MAQVSAGQKPDNKKLLACYPSNPLKVKALDFIVKYFPRRLFHFTSSKRQEKIISHALFFKKKLDQITLPPLSDNYRFCRADLAIIKSLAELPETFREEIYLQRLQSGDICYCLFVDDNLVSFNWVSTIHCSIYCGFQSEISFYKLAEGQIYTYDFYTLVDFRERGYGSVLKNYALAERIKAGAREVYTCVHHDTFPSLIVHLRIGFELVSVAYIYRVMSFSGVLWASKAKTASINKWLQKLNIYKI